MKKGYDAFFICDISFLKLEINVFSFLVKKLDFEVCKISPICVASFWLVFSSISFSFFSYRCIFVALHIVRWRICIVSKWNCDWKLLFLHFLFIFISIDIFNVLFKNINLFFFLQFIYIWVTFVFTNIL